MLNDISVPQAEYQVRIYDHAGVPQGIFTDWRSLDYEKRLNDFDICTFKISGGDFRIPLFIKDAILEVWRRPSGQDWYRETTLFHRTPQIEYTETDLHLYTSYSRGLLDLIHRREIRYTTTAYAEQAGSGEEVIVAFVNQNAGSSANLSFRKSNGSTPGLSVGSSGNGGLSWIGNRSFRNLLDVIQEISGATGVDFACERVGVTGANFAFRTGYPYLGSDRTATVVFGTGYGNFLAPTYTDSATEEVTSVAVLGSGSGSSRTIIVMADSIRAGESPWNVIEGSTNAGGTGTAANLQSAGAEQLAKGKPVEHFNGTIMQTPNCQYGVHYFIGDLVTVQLDNISRTKKIVAAHINVANGKETIAVSFANFGRL